MRILFIYSTQHYECPERPLRDQKEIQFGVSYISSLLKLHGFQTDLLIVTRAIKIQIIDKYIAELCPNLICFTAVTTEYFFISRIARYIKTTYPQIFLLIGGTHASLVPKQVIKGYFDGLCIGEGEYSTLELVKQLKLGKKPNQIPNLWIKDGTRVEKNPTRPFIQDLDRLPFPDREIWQKWIKYPNTGLQVILLGRGCPFQCTYCCNHALKKISSGKYTRLRSVENILQELHELIVRFPETREIYFEVETLGDHLEFVVRLCSALKKINGQHRKPLFFGVNLRIVPNKDYEPFFRTLNSANFRYVIIGLESGCEQIRKNILKRNYLNTDFINAIRSAKKYGIAVNTQNMIGLPGETLEDFKKTIQVNRLCMPNEVYMNIFFPYPGTDLYKFCKKEGLLPSKLDARLERETPNLNLPGFSKKQILKEFQWFNYNVYRGYKPFLVLLALVLYWKLQSHPTFYKLYRTIDNYLYFRRLFFWLKL